MKYPLFGAAFVILFTIMVSGSTRTALASTFVPDDIRVPGATVHYTVLGTGKAIVFVGGVAGSSGNYLFPVAQELSKSHQVIIVDARGTGGSRVDRMDTSVVSPRMLAQDLETIRKKLKIESWVVFGHSWGGMAGMTYATMYPQRARALVLVGSGGRDTKFLTDFHQNIAARLNAQDSARIDVVNNTIRPVNRDRARLEEFKITLKGYVVDQKQLPQIVKYFTAENYFPGTAQAAWGSIFGMNFNLKESLKKYRRPVLQIQGNEDPIGRETALDIRKSVKQSRLEFLKNCGHFPWIDQPERFYGILNKFLSGLR